MNSYEKLLLKHIDQDKKCLVLTAENRAALRKLPAKVPNHFIDVGIAEMSLVGIAAGLALRGRIPIVHALAAFLTMRAYEFIRTDVGYPNLPVKIVGSVAGFLSSGNGPTHQAIEDVGLMSSIPNMRVFCPADYDDMITCLPKILRSPAPYYIRFNDLPSNIIHDEFTEGKAEIIQEGNDITILTYGFLLSQAIIAAEILALNGITSNVVNLRTIKPIDETLILSLAEKTGTLIVLEDHLQCNGVYSIVAQLLLKNGLSPKVLPISLNERWFKPGLIDDVLNYEGFTGEKIAEKINIFLNIKKN